MRFRKTLTVLFAATMLFSLDINESKAQVRGSTACIDHILQAEYIHNIPRGLLMAIAMAESRYDGVPHAWTLNIDGRPYYARDYIEARQKLQEASKNTRNIAIGCMQIFKRYHPHQNPVVYLDPAYGVDYAARYLVKLRERHHTWTQAVARYHAGARNHEAQHRYVCAVWNHLRGMGYPVTQAGVAMCGTTQASR